MTENQEYAPQPDSPVLSPAELSLFTDPLVMPLKFSILAKMELLLASLRNEIAQQMRPAADRFPKEFDVVTGKISKGENYHSNPYRVLDFPRAFDGKDFFTFRSLVLWGHHCSFHLILQGRFKDFFQERIIQRASELPVSMSLSQHPDPWRWEFAAEDYIQARALQEPEIAQAARESTFLKISFFMPLEQYLDVPITGLEVWKLWQMILFVK